MGNTQSNKNGRYSTASSSKRQISGPQSLASSNSLSPAIRRRASANPTPSSHARTDNPPQTHRRARSALAGSSNSIRNRDTAPPPSYSMAVADTTHLAPPPTPMSPTIVVNPPEPTRAPSISPGSSHTRVLAMPSPDIQPIPEAGPSRTPSRQGATRSNSEANAFLQLNKFNTVFIVDDSASMRGARWKEAADALSRLAEIAAKYDADGIDIVFFNSNRVGQNMKNQDAIQSLFKSVQPQGLTPMGERLENLILYYMDNLERAKATSEEAFREIKPVNYIVITDGAPTDAPEDVIVVAARRLDAGHFPITQLGIQFVQIGDNPEAAEFLETLDNDMMTQYQCRDIVDTTPYNGESLTTETLLKILIGAVNRKIDRTGSARRPTL